METYVLNNHHSIFISTGARTCLRSGESRGCILMAKLLHIISRKRPLENTASRGKGGGAELEKCLSTVDLISLGVGSCCGAGMYLTAGIIASTKAGLGGVVSLFLAGLVSVLTGCHYAELAGMCPETSGSAYMYAYVTVGELSAFVIGWGLIVEYVIGTAAAAVALSETFDSLVNKEISTFINSNLDKVGLPHVDVIAAIVCLLLMWLLASGAQMSARVNNILNGLNFVSWAVFIGAAYSLGSRTNWTDHGGFLPFGYQGVLTAIPTAYYAFVGFDGLATTGAECKTPVTSIPISIISSIVINIVVFTSVVIGLTLNVPYKYFAHVCPKRHTAVRATILSGLVATFLAAFVQLHLLIELVLIGTLLAYVIVTFITLIIRFTDIGHVTSSASDKSASAKELTETTPIISSCVIKRKSSDTNLNQLKEDGAKQTVNRQNSGNNEKVYENGEVINLAYEDDERQIYPRRNSANSHFKKYDECKEVVTEALNDYKEISYMFNQSTSLFDVAEPSSPTSRNILTKEWCCTNLDNVTFYLSRHIVVYLLIFYGCLTSMCTILANCFAQIVARNFLVIALLAVLMITVSSLAVFLMFVPQIKRTGDGFRTPLVPLLTVITAGVNIYLMVSLSWMTWLLFLAWLFVGLGIYFLYSTRHSSLNTPRVESSSDLESTEIELLNIPDTNEKENAPLLHSH
ncbi:unnamed protein product [Candidula unifasciata]|uniref:Cationic amino acid transporter n=1 Tax=Candidula unifasciata TaxID=100452 RepID=A0A8S3ZA94_9EUPU|nr:unnamed protein product [Candidula unifasciata]